MIFAKSCIHVPRTVGAADVGVDPAVDLAGAGGAGDGEHAGVRLAGRGVLAVGLARRFYKKPSL